MIKTIDELKSKIICGECCDVMDNQFPADCVDLVVTSPPYDNLRSYNGYTFDYNTIIKSLYRVVKPGGVVVWVVGDQVKSGSESGTSFKQALAFVAAGFNLHDTMIFEKNCSSFPAKKKGNRYTQIFEYMFIFSRGKPKTTNLICDKENKWVGYINFGQKTDRQKDGTLIKKASIKPVPKFSPRNNIWRYVVGGGFGNDKEAYDHPATFPIQLVIDHIKTWSVENDVVLDIMAGSGTTLLAAKELKREWIGIDISQDYCDLMKKRLGT